jgi:sortase (surface protein transpeptidase)
VPTPKSPGAVVPARLRIPNLGIDTEVEQVGVTKDGAMAVPNSYFTVGWYKLGAKPGEIGNAVVAGHYDNPKGPSIFWDLKKLQPGNKIFISDNAGKELTFEVYTSEYYPYDNAPLEKIFGSAKDIQLNLITCGGVFDTKSRNYNERLVVYTRLVQTP